jgi:transformation/transcription domain-associated protein
MKVKTLTFVSYVVRAYLDATKSYEHTIAVCFHSLLMRCPDDAITIRKDLLNSFKAFVSMDIRKALYTYSQDMLNESFLLGPIHSKQSYLRTLAYSTMVEFAYQAKESFDDGQIIRVVHIFCVALQDQTLTISIHMASLRLLTSLIEIISQNITSVSIA